MVSRYTIQMDSNGRGFKILGRSPVHVYLDGPKICINPHHYSVGFFEFRSMLKCIGQLLMTDWKGDEKRWNKLGVKAQAKLRDWAVLQTRKSLAKRIKVAWLEILKTADPIHLNVQRAIFAASAKCSEVAKQEDLYRSENKFLISDILNFRAAALATFHMDIYNGSFWNLEYPFEKTSNINWMKFYAENNEVYPTLKKILPNLPGGIPSWMIPNFQLVRFERPVFDRLELLTILSSPLRNPNKHVLMYAKHDEIRRAIIRVADHLRQQPNTRKVNAIQQAIQFISDFPDKHNGNINGLTIKSCDWHRNQTFRTLFSGSSQYSENTQTAKPPIELPTNPNIKFLSSAGEIAEVADSQKHCIFNYLSGAIRGEYYLFKTEYKNEVACTQVMNNGQVMQSKGFRNSENVACSYSRRVLGTWGKSLKSQSVYTLPTRDYMELPF